MKTMFFVDLNKKPLSIKILNREILKNTESDPFTSVNPDFKMFKSEAVAKKFITEFTKSEKKLAKGRDAAKKPDAPCLIYKHNYLVLSAMKDKNQTVRKYLKPWKKGDLINLYDQTYYLTVKLTDIKKLSSGEYQYDFKPA